jgi:hypothetical protein
MSVAIVGSSDAKSTAAAVVSTTELDSHANMIVAGRQAFVFNYTGEYADVNAFSEEAGGMSQVPIVDAVVAYDCPYTGETYLLVVRNALHVPAMHHNLIPPFIMREAGLVVNDVPKIHVDEPSVEDHSIFDQESGLRIPLKLDGVFSYFPTRALNQNEIDNCEVYKDVFLSPDAPSWNPYDESYAMNEDSYLNHRGDMAYPRSKPSRDWIGVADVGEVAASLHTPQVEDASTEDDANPQECDTEKIDATIDAVIASSTIASVSKSSVDDLQDERIKFKGDRMRGCSKQVLRGNWLYLC